jgi:hypothetical protein
VNTVYGQLCDADGLATNGDRYWCTPAEHINRTQATKILVDLDHDPTAVVGEIVHLDRNRTGLWAVAHINDDVAPSVNVRVGDLDVPVECDLYWSATRRGNSDTGIELLSVALTASPARISARPVQFLRGQLDYRQVARERWHLRGSDCELLTRAAHAYLDRRKAGGGNIRVHDQEQAARWHQLQGRSANTTQAFAYLEDQYEDWKRGRPTGQVFHRPSKVISVS